MVDHHVVCFVFQVIISYESFVYNNAVKCALLSLSRRGGPV